MEIPIGSGGPTAADGVLAIASDDSWAHVYRSVKEMLEEHDIGTHSDHRGGMEFFDLTGRRLAPVLGPAWELWDLVPTGHQAGACELVQRLHAVVRHAEAYVRRHPDQVHPAGTAPEVVLASFPQLLGKNLAEALELVRLSTTADNTHSAGWFHNTLHAAGWNHN
jgi:hypothetical protein